MPQPLSRVKAGAEINVGAQALDQCPQFIPDIMRVIALWAHVDGDMATIFSQLLETDVETGTAVYQAFHGVEARRRALFAAADKALPEWQRVALSAVWKAIEASRDQRDRFAHHVWGYSPDVPSALLLMHSNVVVDVNVSYRTRVDLGGGRGLLAPKDFDRSKVFVYRKNDFEVAKEEARQASSLVSRLYIVIGSGACEQGRRLLLNEPRFQRAVQPLIRRRSPELQAQLAPPGNDPPAAGIWEIWDRTLGRIL